MSLKYSNETAMWEKSCDAKALLTLKYLFLLVKRKNSKKVDNNFKILFSLLAILTLINRSFRLEHNFIV